MPESRQNGSVLPAWGALLAVLALDFVVPLGVAVGVLYVLVIALTLRHEPRARVALAIACTVAIAAVAVLAHSEEVHWMANANRLVSVAAVWTATWLVHRHARTAGQAARSEVNLNQITERARDYSVVSVDLDGRVTSWNPGAQRIQGYAAEDILGQSIDRLRTGEDTGVNAAGAFVRRARAEGDATREGWCERKDGSRHWAHQTLTTVPDAAGGAPSFSLITHDLTRVREQQQRVERKAEELEQFVYTVAHDLKAPLRVAHNYASLLGEELEPDPDPVQEKYLGRILSATDRLHGLLDALVHHARIGWEDDPVEVDLAPLVHDVVESIGAQEAELDIGSLHTVLGQPALLRLLVQNLLGNAMKYRSPDRPLLVTIATESQPDGWLLSVEDTGIGVDVDMKERIFRPFQRDTRVSNVKGDGMGLATCRKVARLHGGDIWVESVPAGGSRFVVRIAVL